MLHCMTCVHARYGISKEGSMRIAVCGEGRSGKDTVSLWLGSNTALRYVESTSEAAARLCYDALKNTYG